MTYLTSQKNRGKNIKKNKKIADFALYFFYKMLYNVHEKRAVVVENFYGVFPTVPDIAVVANEKHY